MARILIIDDDPVSRLLLRETLVPEGFEIQEANSGREGIELSKQTSFDLTLLDLVMPDLDGFATCAELKKLPNRKYSAVVVMTGLGDGPSIDRAYDVGATDFVIKPFQPVILVHRIRYILRSQQYMQTLHDSERRLRATERVARLGGWECVSSDGRLEVSAEMHRVFDLNPGQIQRYSDLLSKIHEEDRARVHELFSHAISSRTGFVSEHRVVLKDRTERIIRQDAYWWSDDSGDDERLMGTAQDITDKRKAEEQLRHLAFFDSLTNLPNRAFLHEHISTALAQANRYERCGALLCLDLDSFKQINDTMGHHVGDQLLMQVADRLRACVRKSDCVTRSDQHAADQDSSVARLGGDEFVILLSDLRRAEDAAVVANRITCAIAEPFELEGHDINTTVSVGIAIFPKDGMDVNVLLRNADTAMYYAKSQGRNTYRFYERSLTAQALERLSLENGLRLALERDEFELHYQPQIDVSTGKPMGVEALIRWRHPQRGPVAPLDFISLAEETGLIVPIGAWVIRTACQQAKRWLDMGLTPLRMAVNVSGKQFRNETLLNTISEVLDETGLSPEYLEVEITENVLMEDLDNGEAIIHQIKALGVKVALDDFGTGYSSLTYLRKFPIDTLKIDRSFIGDVMTNPDTKAIVSSIISLSKRLRLQVVAEGVESIGELDYLTEEGCEIVQGYYFSRPLNAQTFTEWLEARSVRSQNKEPGE